MQKGDIVNITSAMVIDGETVYGTAEGFTVDAVNADGTVRVMYPNGWTCGYAHVTQLTRVA